MKHAKFSMLLAAALMLTSCAAAEAAATPVPRIELAASTISTAAKAEPVLRISHGDSWENNGRRFSKVEVVVETEQKLTSWEVNVPMPESFKLEQIWNGIGEPKQGALLVKNESYNKAIPAGGSAEFGFIYSTGLDGEPEAALAPVPSFAPVIAPAAATSGDDWLSAKDNRIVDARGNEVWLTGLNWFGYNTGTNTFDGLWSANLESSIRAIADRGFNIVRIPFSVELIKKWAAGEYPAANFNRGENPALSEMNSLEIFDYALKTFEAAGVKVMIDMHSAKTDAMGHMSALWTADGISAEDFYLALEWIAARYKNNDTIVALDLKNEPHGKPGESEMAIWNGSESESNWRHVAETAAKRVLAQNPNLLIVIEGIEVYPKDVKANGNFASANGGDYYFSWWGGNLRGVKDFPVDLGAHQNKVVYSPHDYGPAVYNQPWFYSGYTFESLYRDYWRDSWMFIHEDGTAPLLIGEWGGFMTEQNITWMTHLRRLIIENKLSHTFWCFNANSGDTGGLVTDDFKTWNEEKYNFVKPALWQQNGKFVGLDHEIPLGGNGISLLQVE